MHKDLCNLNEVFDFFNQNVFKAFWITLILKSFVQNITSKDIQVGSGWSAVGSRPIFKYCHWQFYLTFIFCWLYKKTNKKENSAVNCPLIFFIFKYFFKERQRWTSLHRRRVDVLHHQQEARMSRLGKRRHVWSKIDHNLMKQINLHVWLNQI